MNNINKKTNTSSIDFNDSPFSKIIARTEHIRLIRSIADTKLATRLNTPLAQGMNIELRSWKKFINQQYIKSLTYNRINSFCSLQVNQSRKGIKYLDDIQSPNIPLNFDSKEGARLDVGIFNEGRMRSRSIEYHNKDTQVLDKMISCSKKILGKGFSPSISSDKRNDTYCLYFPPIFAKHYVKMGLTKMNKSHSPLRIPQYIRDNEIYHNIWWRGNLSEEASLYPSISLKNNKFYVHPRIQLNRVKSNRSCSHNFMKETTYYHHNIPPKYLSYLKFNIMQLILDEVDILKTFNIIIQPYFSKLYANKLGNLTSTYTILLYKLHDLENYFNSVGFELLRHKKQLALLLNSRGGHSMDEIRDVFIKFYKLVPKYLRGNKKIKSNKCLTEEDKQILLGE